MPGAPETPARDGTNPIALVRLLQLVSPALPVGAYAYSQGLEQAVESGWIKDETQTGEWLTGVAAHAVVTLDLPVLARCHDAWLGADAPALAHWSRYLIAARETREARAEDLHLGRSLGLVLKALGVEAPFPWQGERAGFAPWFALAATGWKIGKSDAMAGYLWAWLENQVLAAVKCVPLGQMAGQRLLHAIAVAIPRWVQESLALDDAQVGSSAFAQVLASARHEQQYSRLFRS